MEKNYLQLIYIRRKRKYEENGIEAVLNGKYNVEEKDSNCIKVKTEKNYINGLWGRSISDCYAIVGENGSGKTQIMNMIMEFFSCQKQINSENSIEFSVLFEDIQTENLVYYCLNTNIEFELEEDSSEKQYIKKLTREEMRQISESYKVAYVHNILSRKDYMNNYLCDYNFSIGGLIAQDFRMNVEMHYSSNRIDKLQNYFDKQQFQIVDFIYKIKRKYKKNPFPLPSVMEISFTDDHYNWSYIIKKIKKNQVRNEIEEIQIEEKIHMFKEQIQNMNGKFCKFDNLWINETIKNLILNCFKGIAVSPVVPESNTDLECERFLDLFLENIDNGRTDIYETIINFFSKLRMEVHNKICIDNSIQFIKWLKKNHHEIRLLEVSGENKIIIPVTDERFNFVQELIRLYKNVNWEFPFYTFSFNVSTGEYYFLSLFSELYSIVDKEDGIKNIRAYGPIDSNVKNILLLLDEADLSFHPRWQKMFIYWITEFINLNFVGVKVQIIVATHSPILLSDFPSVNVLYLSKGKKETAMGIQSCITMKDGNKKTFGCNIHTLFFDSFFLEKCGTMGNFAEDKINNLVETLTNYSHGFDEKYAENMIECIGERILQNRLQQLYSRRTSIPMEQMKKKKQDNSVNKTLELLRKQREEIDRLIRELEQKND